jgi:hypothetical protein
VHTGVLELEFSIGQNLTVRLLRRGLFVSSPTAILGRIGESLFVSLVFFWSSEDVLVNLGLARGLSHELLCAR